MNKKLPDKIWLTRTKIKDFQKIIINNQNEINTLLILIQKVNF